MPIKERPQRDKNTNTIIKMYKLNTFLFLLTANIHYASFGIRYDDYKNCFLKNILTYIHKTRLYMHTFRHCHSQSHSLISAYYNIYAIARARIQIFLNSCVKIIQKHDSHKLCLV